MDMKFTIFEITDPNFYNGKTAQEFNALWDNGTKPWFFQPDDWIPAIIDGRAWYGSLVNNRNQTLMPYSEGYASKEEAFEAIEEWEIQKHLGDKQENAFMSLF